ncbi:MAG: hypothetical protein AAGB16_06405 [Pseudomonadota bacterium]
MAPRVLFQLVFFLLPFILFGLYRLAVAEAEQDGRKPWPIRVLFGIGLALAVGSWLLFIFLDRGGGDQCYRAAYVDPETREFVEGSYYPCERDVTGIGIPRSEDPGGQAEGIGERAPLSEPTEIDEETAERLGAPER